jgi:dolichol-phosphate mannosyltransferase
MNRREGSISVIIPAFNEEENIIVLSNKLGELMKQYDNYEILFIDDGSTDRTLDSIKLAKKNNNKIKYISFARNFSHQNALRAGISYAKGDCIISMDADLQHPPEFIPLLIENWYNGYDIVYTIRKDNYKVPYIKRLTSKGFYMLLNLISDTKIEHGAADFRLIDRKVADSLNLLTENDLFYRGMVNWMGYKSIGIEYLAAERAYGKSKYSIGKMLGLALKGITSLSIKPLRISTYFGAIIATFSVIYGLYAMFLKVFTDKAILGWTSIFIMVCLIGGIQLIMIGIVGEYVGKLFIESKKRPNYIIKEIEIQ